MSVRICQTIFIIYFLFLATSCEHKEFQKFELSNDEIEQMLDLLIDEDKKEGYFHIWYSEQLNDSTELVEVWQSMDEPNDSSKALEVVKINNNVIFIYKGLKTNSIPSSFFKLHSNHWSILVKKRNNSLELHKLVLFSPYREDLGVDEPLIDDIY